MHKIGIDVRSITGKKTGKEWYTFSLLEHLVKIDKKNTYYLYSRYDFDMSSYPDNCKKRVIRTPLFLWHIAVMIDMFRKSVDIYLATASYIIASLLFIKKIKVILTVHDLVAFLFPDQHDMKARIIEKITWKFAFKNSTKIICPSQNTKKDLERLFPYLKSKTVFIPEAARETFRILPKDDEKREIILSKYHIPKKYILNIGTLSPRKNLLKLLKAYTLLPVELKSIYSLVFVGGKGWYYQEIFDTVKKLNLEHNVFFAGYVDDFDLPYILERATAFIYPSKYEGFGLPLLEAMACGVPVISSNTPALLEVAEGVCEIVDRKDILDISRGMKKVLLDEKYREDLVQKGLQRVKEYSWDKVAQETFKIIENLG